MPNLFGDVKNVGSRIPTLIFYGVLDTNHSGKERICSVIGNSVNTYRKSSSQELKNYLNNWAVYQPVRVLASQQRGEGDGGRAQISMRAELRNNDS